MLLRCIMLQMQYVIKLVGLSEVDAHAAISQRLDDLYGYASAGGFEDQCAPMQDAAVAPGDAAAAAGGPGAAPGAGAVPGIPPGTPSYQITFRFMSGSVITQEIYACETVRDIRARLNVRVACADLAMLAMLASLLLQS